MLGDMLLTREAVLRLLQSLASLNKTEVHSALEDLQRLANIPSERRSTGENDLYKVLDPKECCDALYKLFLRVSSLFSPDSLSDNVHALELFYSVRKTYINLAIRKLSSECRSGQHVDRKNIHEHLIKLEELLDRDGLWLKGADGLEVLVDDPDDVRGVIIHLLTDEHYAKMEVQASLILARVAWLAVDLTARVWKPVLDEAIKQRKERKAREHETGKTERKGDAERKLGSWPFTVEEKREWVSKIERMQYRMRTSMGEDEYPVVFSSLEAAIAGVTSLCIPSREEAPMEVLEWVVRNIGNITNLFVKPMAQGAVTLYQSRQRLWLADLMEARALVYVIRYGVESPEYKLEKLKLMQQSFYRNRSNHWCYNFLMLRDLTAIIETYGLASIHRQAFWGSPTELGLAHFLFSRLDYQDENDYVGTMAQRCYQGWVRQFEGKSHIPEWLFEIPPQSQMDTRDSWMDDFTIDAHAPVLIEQRRIHEEEERQATLVSVKTHIESATRLLREGKWLEMRRECLSLYLRCRMFGDPILARESLTIVNDMFYGVLLKQTAQEQPVLDESASAATIQSFLYGILNLQLTLSGLFPALTHFFRFLRVNVYDWHSVLDGFSEWLVQNHLELTAKLDAYQDQMRRVGSLFEDIMLCPTMSEMDKQLIYARMSRYALAGGAKAAFHEGIFEKYSKSHESETPFEATGQILKKYDPLEYKLLALMTKDPPFDVPYCVRIDRIDPFIGQNDSYYLRPEVVSELWAPEGISEEQSRETGKPLQQAHQIRNGYPTSLRSVAKSMRIEGVRIHAKGDPRYPAEEYKARALWKQLNGESRREDRPVVFVVMQEEREGRPIGEARLVQITESVSSGAEDVSDGTLSMYATSSGPIPGLDQKHFSTLFLYTLQLNPWDGKGNNYICELGSDGKRRIVSVDNEEGFVAPFRKKTWREDSTYQEYVLQVKTMLYCLPEMDQMIDAEAVDEFLRLDPEKVLREWILDGEKYNRQYETLFSHDGEKKDYERRAKAGSDDPRERFHLSFEKGMISMRYEIIRRLQELLREARNHQWHLTHFDVLQKMEPFLGEIYGHAYRDPKLPTPQARFDSITRTLYARKPICEIVRPIHDTSQDVAEESPVKERMVSVPLSRLVAFSALTYGANSSGKTTHPLEPLAKESGDDALNELSDVGIESHLVEEVLNAVRFGNIAYLQRSWERFLEIDSATGRTRFDLLHCNWFREQLLECIPFKGMAEDQQRPILEGLKKVFSKGRLNLTTRRLILRDCTTLTNHDLMVITSACPQLIWLDVSGCSAISDEGIRAALTHCLLLRRLDMNDLPNIKMLEVGYAVKEGAESNQTGRALQYLSARNNPLLGTVKIDADCLEALYIDGANALKSLHVYSSKLARVMLVRFCSEQVESWKLLFERYPFLTGLSETAKIERLPEPLVKNLISVLDETLTTKRLTTKDLTINHRVEIVQTLDAWVQSILKFQVGAPCWLESAVKALEEESKEKKVKGRETRAITELEERTEGKREKKPVMTEWLRLLIEDIELGTEALRDRLTPAIISWPQAIYELPTTIKNYDWLEPEEKEIIKSKLEKITEGFLAALLTDFSDRRHPLLRDPSIKTFAVKGLKAILELTESGKIVARIIEEVLIQCNSKSEIDKNLPHLLAAIISNLNKLEDSDIVECLNKITEGFTKECGPARRQLMGNTLRAIILGGKTAGSITKFVEEVLDEKYFESGKMEHVGVQIIKESLPSILKNTKRKEIAEGIAQYFLGVLEGESFYREVKGLVEILTSIFKNLDKFTYRAVVESRLRRITEKLLVELRRQNSGEIKPKHKYINVIEEAIYRGDDHRKCDAFVNGLAIIAVNVTRKEIVKEITESFLVWLNSGKDDLKESVWNGLLYIVENLEKMKCKDVAESYLVEITLGLLVNVRHFAKKDQDRLSKALVAIVVSTEQREIAGKVTGSLITRLLREREGDCGERDFLVCTLESIIRSFDQLKRKSAIENCVEENVEGIVMALSSGNSDEKLCFAKLLAIMLGGTERMDCVEKAVRGLMLGQEDQAEAVSRACRKILVKQSRWLVESIQILSHSFEFVLKDFPHVESLNDAFAMTSSSTVRTELFPTAAPVIINAAALSTVGSFRRPTERVVSSGSVQGSSLPHTTSFTGSR